MKEIILHIGFWVVVIALITCFWVFQSNKEMNTFNKFSNQKATLSDAMFSELRILPSD